MSTTKQFLFITILVLCGLFLLLLFLPWASYAGRSGWYSTPDVNMSGFTVYFTSYLGYLGAAALGALFVVPFTSQDKNRTGLICLGSPIVAVLGWLVSILKVINIADDSSYSYGGYSSYVDCDISIWAIIGLVILLIMVVVGVVIFLTVRKEEDAEEPITISQMGADMVCVYALDHVLYGQQLPIAVLSAGLYKRRYDSTIQCMLQMQNMTDSSIRGLHLQLITRDQYGNILPRPEDILLEDLYVKPGQLFGHDLTVILDDNRACSFFIKVISYKLHVSYPVSCDLLLGEEFRISNPIPLEQWINPSMVQSFKALHGPGSTYRPEDRGAYWFCTCGAMNRSDTWQCVHCLQDKTRLFNTTATLNQRYIP